MAGIRQGTQVKFALAAVALIAGCSTSQPATAPPSSAPLTTLDIPAVANPLDVKGFIADPCALLTESDRAELGLPTAEKDGTAGRVACDLHTGAAGQKPLDYLRVQIMTTRGLAGLSAQCGTSAAARCDGWVVDSVAGYPVIRANGAMETKYGACKEFLGISDEAVILINDIKTRGESAPDCARADRIAAMVIRSLTS
jgi:hypothetical protein